jgi:hypothetical protein
MNIWQMTITNRIHVWSLVHPAWELVCRLYPPVMEKLVRISGSKCIRDGVRMRVRLERIKRVVDVLFEV